MNYEKRKAIITLFPSEAGGRIGYITNEYTPNAVFGIDLSILSKYWNGTKYLYNKPDDKNTKNSGIRLELYDTIIYPGGTEMTDFCISIRAYEYLGEELLKAGTLFFLREGSRIIGTGTII